MSPLSLIGTGLGLGVVHVLTGPDHLSALATLSANVGNCRAFSLGIQWGVGHSIGLLLVGGVLIALSQDATVEVPHKMAVAFESLVGVFMLLLGTYGIIRAFQKRRHATTPDRVEELPFHSPPQGVSSLSISDVGGHVHVMSSSSKLPTTSGQQQQYGNPSEQGFSDKGSSLSMEHDDEAVPAAVGCKACMIQCVKGISARTVAILIGIVHGVAGPGGVLGVIPAVQIKDWKLSILYLGSFCLSTTLVMGCFAALYGTCSAKLGKQNAKMEFRIEIFSSSLSILVGTIWLSLLAAGQMDQVFHEGM